MKHLFPQKNFGVSRNRPFCLVFAYQRDGTFVFSGSIDRIEKHFIQNDILCHGLVMEYTKGLPGKSRIRKRYQILGNPTYDACPRYGLTHFNLHSSIKSRGKRVKWELLKLEKGHHSILGTWRVMPHKFLRELDYDLSSNELDKI